VTRQRLIWVLRALQAAALPRDSPSTEPAMQETCGSSRPRARGASCMRSPAKHASQPPAALHSFPQALLLRRQLQVGHRRPAAASRLSSCELCAARDRDLSPASAVRTPGRPASLADSLPQELGTAERLVRCYLVQQRPRGGQDQEHWTGPACASADASSARVEQAQSRSTLPGDHPSAILPAAASSSLRAPPSTVPSAAAMDLPLNALAEAAEELEARTLELDDDDGTAAEGRRAALQAESSIHHAQRASRGRGWTASLRPSRRPASSRGSPPQILLITTTWLHAASRHAPSLPAGAAGT